MSEPSTAIEPSPARNRAPFVITMMLMAGGLFVLTAGLLYFRWATTVEPNCELIVSCAAGLRGAEITVDGMTLPTAYKSIVGDEDRYSEAFFLDPGTYDVKVMLRGELQFSTSVTMKPWTEGTLDLTRVKPTTEPTTVPSDQRGS